MIDADTHAQVPRLGVLDPYLDEVWKQFSRDRGWTGPPGLSVVYPPAMHATAHPHWRPEDGRPPASDVSLLQEHVLNGMSAQYALVNAYYAVETLRHPDWAAAVASAVNNWLIAEWLEKEPRLRASMVVPARDPRGAIMEIDRVGDHPGFVQVLMPVRSDRLYGNRVWHPVYKKMAEKGLVMGIHWGGVSEGAPTPSGWPSWYVEEYAGELQVYTAQVTSMIAEGVFQAIPDLRVSLQEGGFTWCAPWSWRLDKDWRGLRREIPWVTKLPSTLIHEHMRFTTAPLECTSSTELEHFVEWLGSDELLMFATDYPHTHDDDVAVLLKALSPSEQVKVMSENARAWYGLPDADVQT